MRSEALKRKSKTVLKTVSVPVALLLTPLIVVGAFVQAGVCWYMESK